MKKVLVVYQSKTGFAEQYAQWIAQALDCKAVSFDIFLGGLNYENMGFFDRSLMKLVSRAMTKEREMQGPETRIPDATRSFDYSSEQFVQPLVDKVRSLSAR